jgi:cyclopropane fatty-acyl-phospholipid synthase-like methyltransferase
MVHPAAARLAPSKVRHPARLIYEPASEFTLKSEQYRQERARFWDQVAEGKSTLGNGAAAYHRQLEEIRRLHIAPNQRVIEIGCGEGDLLSSVRLSYGQGVDFSARMIC